MTQQERNGLNEAAEISAHAAGAVRGAIKTGKAVSGAAAAALWTHRKAVAAIIAGLLVLPVLFIMLLPSLIFGGLTKAGVEGSPDTPILNDNAAVVENINQISQAISDLLEEGQEDVRARIDADFTVSGADQKEIINPYESSPAYNANRFIAMYCAAKNQDYASISLRDMENVIRKAKDALYTFTSTEESRTTTVTETNTDPKTGKVTVTEREVTEIWKIYGQSPYSYLFCTIPTLEALLEKDLPSSAVIVYGKDRKSLDNISDAIEQMGLSPQDYQLLNRTENQIGRGTSASRAISSASAMLSSVTIFVSAFVLLLVVVLWMRACYKDTAILITLGAKRHEIVFDYFLVTSAISVFALLLSLPVCSLIINGYGNRMIEHIFVATGNLSGLEIDNYMTAALNQPLEWTAYLKSQFMLLLVVWTATLIASVNILKNKPAKLFNMS